MHPWGGVGWVGVHCSDRVLYCCVPPLPVESIFSFSVSVKLSTEKKCQLTHHSWLPL